MLPLIEGSTVLDVGCGRGKWGHLLRVQWWCTKNGKANAEPGYLVGADIFLPFLQTVRHHQIYDDVILCHAAYLPIRDAAFDSVLASELLEHMVKSEGELLLSELERVSKKVVVLTTPHFVRRRPGLSCPEGFNPYEQHVCGWGIRELRSRGYEVYGTGFLFLILISPRLSAVLSPLSFLVPQFSSHLIAIKKFA